MKLLSRLVAGLEHFLRRQVQQKFFAEFALALATVSCLVGAALATSVPIGLVNGFQAGLCVSLIVGLRLGMTMDTACKIATSLTTVVLGVSSWYSGGIYSTATTWLGVLVVANYFILGSRFAILSLLASVAIETALAWARDWTGYGPVVDQLDASDAQLSLIDNSLVFLAITLVILLYRQTDAKALRELDLRQKALGQQRTELEHTMAARDQFIAAVNHEVKQPLSAIAQLSDSMLASGTHSPDVCMVLEHTSSSALQIQATVTDLLDYTRLQSGQLQTRMEALQLQVEMHTAFATLQARRNNPALRNALEIDSNLRAPLFSDKALLALILEKLIDNACRFTPTGQITLSAQRSGEDAVVIAVQDSGSGMAATEREQLQMTLGAGVPMQVGHRRGSGLGLLIAQGLTKLLGGDLGFESTPYQGSRFWVRLPLAGPPSDRPAARKPPGAGQTG